MPPYDMNIYNNSIIYLENIQLIVLSKINKPHKKQIIIYIYKWKVYSGNTKVLHRVDAFRTAELQICR